MAFLSRIRLRTARHNGPVPRPIHQPLAPAPQVLKQSPYDIGAIECVSILIRAFDVGSPCCFEDGGMLTVLIGQDCGGVEGMMVDSSSFEKQRNMDEILGWTM